MSDDSFFEIQEFINPKKSVPEIEGFHIERQIGEGGMGKVYLAQQQSLEREVAIKAIANSNEITRKRFVEEAKIVAQLNHPGIANVYDFKTVGDKNYIIMEYLPGKGIDEVIKSRELSPFRALQIIAEIAKILEHTHAQKIIHRDIKPSNIRLDINGQAKLLDFGLAKVSKGLGTLEGTMIGTPKYMSPEQAQGRNEDIDERSDLYALGLVLYEMLTGKPAVEGNNIPNIVYEIVHGKTKPPQELNENIDDAIENICLKAMAKNPQNRYQSARELYEDIQRYLSTQQPQEDEVVSQISCIQQSSPPFIIEVCATSNHGRQDEFTIGDNIHICFKSEKSCYIYLVNIGPTQDITVLYPNKFATNNHIQANREYTFPRKEDSFDFQLQNPPGKEIIYAIGSTSPKNIMEVDWHNLEQGFYSPPRAQRTRNIAIVAKNIQNQKSENWSSSRCEFAKK